jgi:hypothetical protein
MKSAGPMPHCGASELRDFLPYVLSCCFNHVWQQDLSGMMPIGPSMDGMPNLSICVQSMACMHVIAVFGLVMRRVLKLSDYSCKHLSDLCL